MFCVLAVWVVTCITFMSTSNKSLSWLISIIGSGNLLTYCVFRITYIRFHRAQKAHGVTDDQHSCFRRHQYRYSIASLTICIVVNLINGFKVFTRGNWSVANFVFAWFSGFLFIAAYLGYRSLEPPSMPPLEQVALHAGRKPADIDDGYTEPEPRTRLQKFNRWFGGQAPRCPREQALEQGEPSREKSLWQRRARRLVARLNSKLAPELP